MNEAEKKARELLSKEDTSALKNRIKQMRGDYENNEIETSEENK